jgi:hypothetical protein
MLSLAAPDLPEQVREFVAVHRSAEDGEEPAVEVPALLAEFPANGEVIGCGALWRHHLVVSGLWL